MKADYLNGTAYSIVQPAGMYHINSDTELLGRFLHVRRNDRVLDIGCAGGALLLYAAHQGAQHLYGIDLFEDVLNVCEENLRRNQVSAVLSRTPLQEYRADRFDVIVCNPPYFRTMDERLKNSSKIIRAARHEEYLKPAELFSSVKRLLKDNGRFYLVHRASRLNELLNNARDAGLQAVRMRVAYASQNGDGRSVLIEFRCGEGRELKIQKPVFLDQRETFADEREEKR